MKLGSVQSFQGPLADPASGNETVDLVGDSESLRHVRRRMTQVAPTNATVLLLGETGTGKGVAARLIHQLSPRRDARFVSVDCTSVPATLIGSGSTHRTRAGAPSGVVAGSVTVNVAPHPRPPLVASPSHRAIRPDGVQPKVPVPARCGRDPPCRVRPGTPRTRKAGTHDRCRGQCRRRRDRPTCSFARAGTRSRPLAR
jgi:Sigma-54 interaction domain